MSPLPTGPRLTDLQRELLQSMFEDIYDSFQERLRRRYAVSGTLKGKPQARINASDVLQSAMKKLVEQVAEKEEEDTAFIEGLPNPEILLNKRAEDKLRDNLRRIYAEMRNARRECGEDALASVCDASSDVENEAVEREMQDSIASACEQLTDIQRRALVFVCEGYTAAKIGEMEGCSEVAARARVHAAREELRKLLRPLMGNENPD